MKRREQQRVVYGPGTYNPTVAQTWYTPLCGHLHLSDDGNLSHSCPDGLREMAQLPETAGDYPPARHHAFLAGVMFGLIVAAVVLVMVAR